jgi:hypothetical protein
MGHSFKTLLGFSFLSLIPMSMRGAEGPAAILDSPAMLASLAFIAFIAFFAFFCYIETFLVIPGGA